MRRDNRKHAPVRQPRNVDGEQSFAFRRSRTITGSAATSVQAASEGRGQLKSPRLHEHSLRKHRRRLLLYLVSILAVCGALWYVISSYIGGTVAVGTRATQSTRIALDTSRYQAMVAKYLQDRPFERFVFALNDDAFDQYMRAGAAELSSAQLEQGQGIGNAELVVELREPVVAWTIKGQQYFVDAEGMAFITNYFGAPRVVVTDKSGISADAGLVASNKLLRFIGRVITLVNESDITPVELVELPANSTRQVDFKLKDRGYIIKAHMDRDPAGQAADIVNAVRYVESKGLNVAYLDVRVSSKAYYRD